MNTRVLRAGSAGGMTGGAVMAAFSMITLWLAGNGFWTPLNLIAHTFWRSAPLDGRFSGAALVIGMAVHLTMAMLFGALIAAAAVRIPGARSLVIAAGILFTVVLWAVMQYGIWRAVDATAARDFTPWVFAVAHLLFGMMAASWAAIAIPDADPPPRHALPRQPAGPRNWFALSWPRIGASQPVIPSSPAAAGGRQMIMLARRADPGRGAHRSAGVRVGPVRLHTHSVIAGLIFIGLGVVFLRYQGTAGLTGLLAPPSLTGWDNRLQDAVTAIQAHVPDLALLAAAAAMVIAVAAWRLRRARRHVLADPPPSAGQPPPVAPGTGEPAEREPPEREPADETDHGEAQADGFTDRAGPARRPR